MNTFHAHDFDEYGPNRDGECHFGDCHKPARFFRQLGEVPYCEQHYLARLALRDRLAERSSR